MKTNENHRYWVLRATLLPISRLIKRNKSDLKGYRKIYHPSPQSKQFNVEAGALGAHTADCQLAADTALVVVDPDRHLTHQEWDEKAGLHNFGLDTALRHRTGQVGVYRSSLVGGLHRTDREEVHQRDAAVDARRKGCQLAAVHTAVVAGMVIPPVAHQHHRRAVRREGHCYMAYAKDATRTHIPVVAIWKDLFSKSLNK
jgi:hypothetical protein